MNSTLRVIPPVVACMAEIPHPGAYSVVWPLDLFLFYFQAGNSRTEIDELEYRFWGQEISPLFFNIWEPAVAFGTAEGPTQAVAFEDFIYYLHFSTRNRHQSTQI